MCSIVYNYVFVFKINNLANSRRMKPKQTELVVKLEKQVQSKRKPTVEFDMRSATKKVLYQRWGRKRRGKNEAKKKIFVGGEKYFY